MKMFHALLIELQGANPGTRYLFALLPIMSNDFRRNALANALNSTQTIDDEAQQAKTLASLLPHLSSETRHEVITRVLELAKKSEWKEDRVWLLSAVVPLERSAREREVEDLLKLAESILENDPDIRGVAAIVKVLPYLDRELKRRFTERAFQAVHGMRRTELRARSLCALIPVLPLAARRRTIDELLDLAANIKNEYERAEILSDILPYLPKRRLYQVLSAAQKMRNEPARVEVLAKMASNSPQDLIPKVLACAMTISDDGDRFRVFCALGHYPHALKASDALAQATASARLWWEDEPRANVLENLVPAWLRLIREDRSEALRLLRSQLHQMAARSRYDLLSDLRVFIPVVVALAGPEAAIGAAEGILDVGRWWS